MSLFDMFKRSNDDYNKSYNPENKKPVKAKNNNVSPTAFNRRFTGAAFNPNNRFNISWNKINADLRNDGIQLILRCRDLAKNNQMVASYLNWVIRSVLGDQGFRLNCVSYNEDGTSDLKANQQIEDAWYDFTKSYRKWVSADEQLNDIQLDTQILWNFLIDGECYLHKVKDSKSKYGIRFEVIDALAVDFMYNEMELKRDGTRIVTGIKVNEHYKPLSYFIRKDRSADYYLAGERVEVPANQIIHIYRKLFPDQVRGFSTLAPVLLNLNSLEEYKRAQISAAIINSAFFGVYQQMSSTSDSYDDYSEEEVDKNGDIATELQSNAIRWCPSGYKYQQVSVNHPNPNVPTFFKGMLKNIASALGLSYNKLASDYQSVNYSSLRQANLEDEVFIKNLQGFIISNWKDIEFAEWLKNLLATDITDLPYTKLDKFMEHVFTARNFEYLDPSKELQAVEKRLQLGLSSPIEEIHNMGRDPIDTLNSWQKFNEMCKQRGLKFNYSTIDENNEQKNDENNEQENQ